MVRSSFARFGIVWAILVMFGFILGALFGPLNARTDFLIGMGVIPVGAVIAYLVVYRMDVFTSDVPETK